MEIETLTRKEEIDRKTSASECDNGAATIIAVQRGIAIMPNTGTTNRFESSTTVETQLK
jgi:hypothetical protein